MNKAPENLFCSSWASAIPPTCGIAAARFFANSYRTIALDNRGVGQSDVTPGIYSIALMASDAAAVLHAAGVESAHVFGVSRGGMIAQEFALQYPNRVRSLILAAPRRAVPMPCRPNLPRCKLLCAVTSLLKNPRRPSSHSL